MPKDKVPSNPPQAKEVVMYERLEPPTCCQKDCNRKVTHRILRGGKYYPICYFHLKNLEMDPNIQLRDIKSHEEDFGGLIGSASLVGTGFEQGPFDLPLERKAELRRQEAEDKERWKRNTELSKSKKTALRTRFAFANDEDKIHITGTNGQKLIRLYDVVYTEKGEPLHRVDKDGNITEHLG